MPRATHCRKVRGHTSSCYILDQTTFIRSLFINTALMSWAFDFLEDPSAPIDSMGFIGGGVVRILPYKVIIQARQDRDDIERLLKTEDVPYQ